jgi:hypothetical protein
MIRLSTFIIASVFDYVFGQPEAPVLSAEIIRTADAGRYPSDHFPVAAGVRLPWGGKRAEPDYDRYRAALRRSDRSNRPTAASPIPRIARSARERFNRLAVVSSHA